MPLLWMYLCFSLNIAWQDLSLCLWLLYVFWVSPSAEGQDFANPESNPRPTPLETETPWGPVPAAPPFGAVVAPLPSPWPLPLMPLCFHHLRLWEDFTQGLGGRCSNLSKQKGGRRDPRSGPCSAPLPISRWSPHEVTCTCRFSPAAFGCRACYSSRRLWGHAPRARISQDEKEMVHVVMSKMIEMIMTCQRTMTVINPAIGIWIPIPILFRHRKKNRSCSYSHMGMDQYL